MTSRAEFPFAGKTFRLEYDGSILTLEYSSENDTVSYVTVNGLGESESAQVKFKWKRLEAGNYLISWQQHDGTTVVHVDNLQSASSDAFRTSPDGTFIHLEGRLKEEKL